MADTYPHKVQRPALLELETALDSWHRAICRDDCGDWQLVGDAGKIYAVPEGFQIFVDTGSPRAWTFAKYKLEEIGARLQNDGDEGGSAFITSVPTPAQAKIIRKLIGVRQRRHLSDEQRERLADLTAQHRFVALSAR